jgi:hypothetical protein
VGQFSFPNLGGYRLGSAERGGNGRRALQGKTHDALGQFSILNAVEFDPDRPTPPVDPLTYVPSTDPSAVQNEPQAGRHRRSRP